MNKVLACIDPSIYATSVVDHAAWAAERLDAAVEVLHVIQRKDAVAARHDLSGAVGLGAKSALLDELTRIDEAEGKLAQEKGRVLLASAKARLEELGRSLGVSKERVRQLEQRALEKLRSHIERRIEHRPEEPGDLMVEMVDA